MGVRPFVKWAGGKRQLLPALLPYVPEGVETYYEPFVGGGALFFALAEHSELAPKRAVLNDLNGDLMLAYEVVRDRVDDLIESLGALATPYLAADHKGRADLYYAERDARPQTDLKRVARLIFLNKTCFNGLYRVNKSGEFNVPHGRYATPAILDADGLRAASRALQGTELLTGDFEESCLQAGPGDFVYFDPPFLPLPDTANFTSYTGRGFGPEQQFRLKLLVDRLRDNGVQVMLSNSAHWWIVGAYEASCYLVERTPARRAINSRGDGRGAIDELIVTTSPEVRDAVIATG